MSGAIGGVGGVGGMASIGGAGGIGGGAGGGGIASIGASGDGNASAKADMGNMSIGGADKGMQDIGDAGKSGGARGIGKGGLSINQSQTNVFIETNISIEQSTTEISINFGDTAEAMDKVFELFSGKGQDEKLLELMLAIFEKQQEDIKKLFDALMEMTGMSNSLNAQG